jgi:hypothetical protein
MAMRTPVNRGFSAPRRSFNVNPVVARKYAGGANLPGTPKLGRRARLARFIPYPPPPPWWSGVIAEWAVYWYLTTRKHFQEGKDFYYQAPVFAPHLFRARDFTRVDFLVDLGPRSRAGQIGKYTALAMDPFTNFTHPNIQLDKDKRSDLDLDGYLLIFLYEPQLLLGPGYLVEEALRGRDHSSRR